MSSETYSQCMSAIDYIGQIENQIYQSTPKDIIMKSKHFSLIYLRLQEHSYLHEKPANRKPSASLTF